MGLIQGMPAWSWKAQKEGLRPVHIDPTQHAIVTTEAEHHEIHEGHMWHHTFYDADVDIATPLTITLTSPAEYALGEDYKSATHGGETYVHFAAEVYADGQVLVQFYEGGTVASGVDDSANIHNRNRDVAVDTPQSTIYYGTSLTGGTLLSQAIVGNTGNPIQRASGAARSGLEWVLKHSEDYTIKITAAQDNTLVVVNIDFYEHIHKDDWNELLVQGAI